MIQQVTQFTDSELETIAQIWLQSNLDAHDFISAAHWQDNYDFVKNPLPMPLSHLFGGGSARHRDVDDYIAGIFVLKDYRALGIGKQLYKKYKQNTRS